MHQDISGHLTPLFLRETLDLTAAELKAATARRSASPREGRTRRVASGGSTRLTRTIQRMKGRLDKIRRVTDVQSRSMTGGRH